MYIHKIYKGSIYLNGSSNSISFKTSPILKKILSKERE